MTTRDTRVFEGPNGTFYVCDGPIIMINLPKQSFLYYGCPVKEFAAALRRVADELDPPGGKAP